MIYWLEKSAEAGQIGAMNTLGELFMEGKYVPRDADKAKYWFNRLIKLADHQEAMSVADGYFNGTNGSVQNRDRALNLYRLLRENATDPAIKKAAEDKAREIESGFEVAYADMLEKYAYAQKVAQDKDTPDDAVLGAIRSCLENGLQTSAALFGVDYDSYEKDKRLMACIDDIGHRGYACKSSMDTMHKLRMLGNKGAHGEKIKPWDMRSARELLPMLPDIFREICAAIPGAGSSAGRQQDGARSERRQSVRKQERI